MYDRMLNKQKIPTFDDLVRYSGGRVISAGGEDKNVWLFYS